MMKLCVFLAVAAAHRVSELEKLDAVDQSGNSKPQKGVVNVLLVSGLEFDAMERPVLSHQMEIKPGAPGMAIDIQDRTNTRMNGRPFPSTGYNIEVVGSNGSNMTGYNNVQVMTGDNIKVGSLKAKTQKSKIYQTKYEFQTTSGKSMLRMYIPHWGQMATRTAYVTSDVKKNPHTYYTFSKDGKGWLEARMSGGETTMGLQKEVVFSVFKGRAVEFNTPYLEAKGQFLHLKFQFYLAGQAAPVAVMQLTDKKFYGSHGRGQKNRYQIKMKSGVDPIMLSMLVGFIDSCKNNGGGTGGSNLDDRRRRSNFR